MADIFFDEENNNTFNQINEQSRKAFDAENEIYDKKDQQYLQDLQKYQVYLPQQQYEIINTAIANAEIPEDEAYRWASALELSNQYGIDTGEAYQNLEQIIAAKWGEEYKYTPKTAFKAIVDSGKLGVNTLKQGNLGLQIMAAELSGGENLTELLDKYYAIEKENEGLYDYMDRNIVIEALKFGAQSAPFTGYVAGMGILGSLLAPGVGTAASFTASMANATGLQYMSLRKDGSEIGAATGLSLVSGGLEAVVEVALGNVAGALGKNALGNSARKAISEKITSNVFKRLNYNGTMKSLAGKLAKEYLKENFEEGMEEVVQDLIEKGTTALAAELGNYDIDGVTATEIARSAWENFYGGVLGSLVLGLPTSAIKVRSEVKEFKKVRDLAEEIPSTEVFKKMTENSPIFNEMDEEEKSKWQSEIHKNVQDQVDAELNLKAKEYGEVIGTEGFEEEVTDEETGDTVVEPEYRSEETGKLHIQNDITSQEENGNYTGVYQAGNPTQENHNSYATIKYSVDEENKTVTIDELQMGKTRLGLRGEVYDSFAQDFAGYDIKWDPIGKYAKDWKQEFINANPSGVNNNLNYYKSKEVIEDATTRKKVAAEIKNNIKNITDKETAAGVALLEAAAKRMGYSIAEYVDKTFATNIFGNIEEVEKLAQRQGDTFEGKAGASTWRNFGREVKAVIYAGENADFSTWAHELAHVFQAQLEGDLKTQAEEAFNVKDGDWRKSTYNGMSSAEAFAYGFQDWLKTGRAENEAMKNIFQKFAEYISHCFNALKDHIQFTPEIESVYNQLLKGDDSMLAAAERAVEQQDAEAKKAAEAKKRNEEKRAAEEQQEQKQAAEDQRVDESEVIRTEPAEQTEEKPAKKKDVPTNRMGYDRILKYPDSYEKYKVLRHKVGAIQFHGGQWFEAMEAIKRMDPLYFNQWSNALTNILNKTNLTEAQQEEIASTLDNVDASVMEKTEAANTAAESAYDPNEEVDFQGGKDWVQRNTEATKLLSDRRLFSEKEQKRIEKNFERLYMTPWHKQTIESILIRADMFDVFEGKPMSHNSKLGAPTCSEVIPYLKDGPEALLRYLKIKHFIGSTDKAGMVVNSSFTACDPSLDCAEFCYAANGTYAYPSPAVKSELISWYIETYPETAAKQIAGEYKLTPEYQLHKALRLFDKGDITEAWIPVIKHLNKEGVHCQIFTKRPDLLRQIDMKYNVVMLSIDKSNLSLAEDPLYYDMPIAFVYSGIDDIPFIVKNKDRFLKYGGSILPVQIGNEPFDYTAVQALPLWARPFCCPVDSGVAVIPKNNTPEKNPDNKPVFTCGRCNSSGGVGCFYHRVTIFEEKYKNIDDRPLTEREEGEYDQELKELQQFITDAETAGNEQLANFIRSELDKLLSKVRKGIDPEREAGSISQARSALASQSGNNEGYEQFRTDKNSKLAFQIAGEIGAENLDKVEEVTTRVDNRRIAEEMLAAGKDDLEVKLATGWERGADGQWRYEIPDFKIKENPTWIEKEYDGMKYHYGLLSELIDAPELFKAYPELKNLTVHTSLRDTTTLGQYSEFTKDISLNNSYENAPNPEYVAALEEYRNSEDFKNYKKQLDALDILSDDWDEQADKLEEEFKKTEAYKKEQAAMKLPKRLSKLSPDTLNTLVHEVQHAIQGIEGFARGGSTLTAKSLISDFIKKQNEITFNNELAYEQIEDVVKKRTAVNYFLNRKRYEDLKVFRKSSAFLEYGPFVLPKEKNARKEALKQAYDKWSYAQRSIIGGIALSGLYDPMYLNELEENELKNKYDELTTNLEKLYNLSGNMGKAKAEIAKLDKFTDYELYERLAGEVEARNTETRLNKSEDFRRNTLLEQTEDIARAEQYLSFQEVTDPNEIERLENEPKVKAYRAMQLIDGKLYPPMSAKIDGKLRDPIKLNTWERADENPAMADSKGMFKLNKGNGKTILARYNPYFHSSPTMLNDQFSEAQDRDNLVTVEVEIPASELNNENPYRAEKAKDTVGIKQWKAGIIQSQLTGTREVNLSRWDKPIRIVPAAEVAQNIVNSFGDKNIVMPSNVVPPAVRTELEKLGVSFVNTTNKGILTEGNNAGNHYSKVYGNNVTADNILYQTAYHGSAADFDKFNTDQYGLSGEGSMSFGYGTYVTGSEEIARDYAQRQWYDKAGNKAYLEEELKRQEEDLVKAKEDYDNFQSYDDYKAEIEARIAKYESFIQKKKEEGVSDFITQKALERAKEKLNEEAYNKLKDQAKNAISYVEKEIADLKTKIAAVENNKDLKRNLYTIDIPDNGFIKWEKNVRRSTINKVKEALFRKLAYEPDMDGELPYKGVENELRRELNEVFNSDYEGRSLYGTIASYLGSEKNASKFLNDLGYVGIDYPAGTNFGSPEKDARNYIIFDDSDAKIVEHLQYQTQEELYSEARTFDTWQEFMEFYEVMGRPEVTPIPYDADAQWYQTTWELANKVTPEESINEAIVEDKKAAEGTVPAALDSLFVTNVVMNDEALLDFLETAASYAEIDLNSDEYRNAATQEEAQDRERISDLQDYMKTIMYSRSFNEALNALKAGHEVPANVLKNVRGEMRDNFKSRDFRALYAEVMGDEQYAVDEADSITSIMNERRAKNPERYYDIVKPEEDISRYSPEKRKQIALAMDNADLAAKVKSGKLKMNDEVNNYIKSLDKEIAGLKKDLRDQEIEQENDFKRIADAERRELLKLHDKMLLAKAAYNKATQDEVNRKINRAIRTTSKYKRESQNLKANYDELFRKFNDLKTVITLDAQVQEALKRQEKIHEIKEEVQTKQQEKSRAAEEKKLRIQLVKRTMRRIDFSKIDYEDAKTIIAIQRLFEPNLLGGVNRWIGTEGPFLRGVISGILTDVEYKEEIEKYLRKNAKSSQQFADFMTLLHNTTSLEDFNKWTQQQRKQALRYLPKENWIRDLNLMKLAKEREESIDLDIDTVEVQKPLIDEKTGKVKTYKNEDGDTVQATVTGWKLQYSDEIAQRVQDAIGADMFNDLINVPFADWTYEQLEELATRINGLYKQGRDLLEGKKIARKEAADAIRQQIETAVKNTGIIINDDDDDETKKRKQEKINKILGLTGSNTKGSDTSKDTGFKARLNRLLHSYNDANVLRVARILDGYTEGTNVQELYRKEDTCYINKTRSMNERAARIQQVMKENNITPADLATIVKVEVPSYDTVNPILIQEYTIDDLLYFAAAAEDYELKDNGMYDDFAACSKNAVMYGNMFASAADLEAKQAIAQDDEVDETGASMGLKQYIVRCNTRFEKVLEAAKALDPKYQALAAAIAEDYAAQYDRMNKVSVEQFNSPVHRVKAYVPLNRLESNGDTNINKVREDLLAAMGANATKQGVNKGMTARRVRINPLNQKPVVTGLYKTWADSVERTEHFIAYAEYVNELNRVYKNRDANFTRQFIENRYGKGMLRYIDDYINEVANPNANKVREAGAELLHTLRGRTAPAYLAWKASAIVKQGLTSPWPFMQYINPAEYAAASWKAVTSHGKLYDAIREKSVYMNNRVMDPMNDMIDEMAEHGKTKFDRFMGKQSQIGMAGLEWIDWVCVAPGWYAAYTKKYAELNGKNQNVYEAVKARLEEENAFADYGTTAWKTAEQIEAEAMKAMEDDVETRAVQYADDITRACQPSNRSVDISPLFKNSSEAMKAYLQFQTSLNVIWQNIRYDIPYAIKKQQFLQIAGCIVGYALAGIFMNSVMDGLPDDDEDKLKALTYYATTQFTDAVPMIGSELTNTMDKLITGKQQFMNSGTDMTPTATKVFSILTNAKKGNWEKAAEMTTEGIGMYLGLPVSGMKEVGKLTGIGDLDGEAGIHLDKVYGILDKED